MNKALFLEAIDCDIKGLSKALELSPADVLDLINGEDGFPPQDWLTIKEKYNLTAEQICSIILYTGDAPTGGPKVQI